MVHLNYLPKLPIDQVQILLLQGSQITDRVSTTTVFGLQSYAKKYRKIGLYVVKWP